MNPDFMQYLSSQSPQTAVPPTVPNIPATGAQQQILPDAVAKRIGYLSTKHDRGGLNVEDTHEALQHAENYLKLDKKTKQKMPLSQMLSELGGLLTNRQHRTVSLQGRQDALQGL